MRKARELGIAEDRWIYLWGGADVKERPPLELLRAQARVASQFLPGDAVFRSFTGQQQPLSLTGPTTVRLHRTREANVFLGGRALPAAGQRAGHYSATVVVVLAPSGA